VVPDARGEAARDVEQARADASTLEARARGDAARFEALLGPWRAEPGALRAQLEAELLRDLGEDLTVMSAAPGTELYLE
jgi:membrane protease subunit HflK